MKSRSKQVFLSLAVALALGGMVVADASAQSRDSNRSSRSKKADKAQEALYPDATREAPTVKASAKAGKKLQKLIDVYNKDDFAQTITLAQEVLAEQSANEYDKSLAAQIASEKYNTQ